MAYTYEISFAPKHFCNGLPEEILLANRISIGSMVYNDIQESFAASFKILDSLIKKGGGPEKMISIIQVNPPYKSITDIFPPSVFISEQDAIKYELGKIPFAHGCILRILIATIDGDEKEFSVKNMCGTINYHQDQTFGVKSAQTHH